MRAMTRKLDASDAILREVRSSKIMLFKQLRQTNVMIDRLMRQTPPPPGGETYSSSN